MLDIKFIRENPEKVAEGASAKHFESSANVGEILKRDDEYRQLFKELQELFAKRNAVAKERDIETGRELKGKITSKEGRLKELKAELDLMLTTIPNLPAPDVKVGKNESENDVVRTVGTPKKFSFKPRDHVELG